MVNKTYLLEVTADTGAMPAMGGIIAEMRSLRDDAVNAAESVAVVDAALVLFNANVTTTKASEAASSATTATTKASEAAASAAAANTKATEAAASATTATTKASEAATSAAAAQTSQNSAASSATTTTTKASEAAASAAAALTSKNSAASSATTATTKASEATASAAAAQTSQNSAASSATTATTKASEAAISAAAASASAAAAQTSQNSAASSATTATTKASEAAASAAAALTSRNSAASSVTTATTKASEAAASAAAALTSKNSAASSATTATTKASEAAASAAAADSTVANRLGKTYHLNNFSELRTRLRYSGATGDQFNVEDGTTVFVPGRGQFDVTDATPNLFLWSEQFENAVWTKIGTSVTRNATLAPDGMMSADKIVATSGLGNKGIAQSHGGRLLAGMVATSVYAKKAELDVLQIRWFGGTTGVSARYCNFNLTTGQMNGNHTGSASMENVGDGWWRLSVVTAIDGTLEQQDSAFEIIDNISQGRRPEITANGVSGLFLWGAQTQNTAVSKYRQSEDAFDAPDLDYTNIGGVKLYSLESLATRRTIEVTVGSNGQFSTLNAALKFLDGQRRTYGSGATATVRLLTGFVMAEQIIVDGQDLGWIKIVSDASSVAVSHTAITRSLVTIDAVVPIFGGINGATLPIIGTLFAYSSNTTAKDGVAVYGGSVAQIEPGCGVRRCRRGIQAYNASRVFCNIDGLRSSAGSATTQLGVDFRECSGRALDVQQGSFASLPRSNFNDCGGDNAVYFIWGSSGNIYQSSVRRAAGTAILARDASVLCARECDMDQAGNRAIHALHGAVIDARSKVAGEGSLFGTFGAKNCLGSIAVLANAASSIDAAELDVSGASGRGFTADQGSTINAELANASNCNSFGMIADRASVINANGSIATGCATGYNANDGSTINAKSGQANNCSGFGVLATSASRINAHSLTATGCATSVEARDGSNIDARLAVLTGSTTRALSAIDGGELNCQGAVTTGASSFHLTVRGGGRVAARDFLGNIDLRDGGGIVHNSGGTGSVSQTINTLTAQGVIFR